MWGVSSTSEVPTAMVICSMCRGQRCLGKRQSKIVLLAEESEVQSKRGHNVHSRKQRSEVKTPGRRSWMQKGQTRDSSRSMGHMSREPRVTPGAHWRPRSLVVSRGHLVFARKLPFRAGRVTVRQP